MVFILVVAFLLRVVGIGFGLPMLCHQDEPIVVNHALAYAGGDLNPHFFKVPPLLSYALAAVYGLYFILARWLLQISTEDFAILFFKDPSSFYWLGRFIFGACFGTASVYLIYRIACRSFGPFGARAAACFLASNYLHVRDSHYLYVDIPMVFAMLMAVESFSSYRLEHRERALPFAAFWAGVAIAFKYIAAPLLFFIALGAPKKNWINRARLLLIGSLAYVVLNPFSLVDFSFFLREIQQQAAAESAKPLWHHLNYSLAEGCGYPLLILGILGLALGFKSRQIPGTLALFPFAFYALLVFFSQPYERYVLPIVPFLCLGAAYFFKGDLFGGASPLRVLILVLTLALPLWKSIYLDQIALREDTRVLAARWIEANVPGHEGIAMQHAFFSPKIQLEPSQLGVMAERAQKASFHSGLKSKKIEYMRRAQEGQKSFRVFGLRDGGLREAPFLTGPPLVDATTTALAENNISYFVRYRHAGEAPEISVILGRAERLISFSPYRDFEKTDSADRWAWVALPYATRELFSRVRPGPYLEIYRLKA